MRRPRGIDNSYPGDKDGSPALPTNLPNKRLGHGWRDKQIFNVQPICDAVEYVLMRDIHN